MVGRNWESRSPPSPYAKQPERQHHAHVENRVVDREGADDAEQQDDRHEDTARARCSNSFERP